MSASTVPAGTPRVATGRGVQTAPPTAAAVAVPRRRSVVWTPRDAVAFLAAGLLGGSAAGVVTWWVMSNVTIPIHI